MYVVWNCLLYTSSGEAGQYSWNDTFRWLETRRGLLDGVVFSGGEPLLQKQLPEAIGQIHQNGFEVALHTSGVYPERLSKVLPLIEWVGLDIKAPFDEYEPVSYTHLDVYKRQVSG